MRSPHAESNTNAKSTLNLAAGSLRTQIESFMAYVLAHNRVPEQAPSWLINAKLSEDGDTPLYIATHKGKIRAVIELLAQGGDVNIANVNGHTPLFVAELLGHTDIVKELSEYTAHEREIRIFKDSIKEQDAPAVIGLLETRPSLSNIKLECNLTPLSLAASVGDVAIVRILLEAGAVIDRPGANGHTPLHLAAEHGKAAVVEQLLKAGAKVDQAGHETVARLLIDAEEVNPTDAERRLAFQNLCVIEEVRIKPSDSGTIQDVKIKGCGTALKNCLKNLICRTKRVSPSRITNSVTYSR